MKRLAVAPTALPDLFRVKRQRLGDRRGHFARIFCAEELKPCGWHKPIAQINHSHTARRGMVRGLHFQHPPQEEMKLVTCLRGEAWDVAVDLRAHSPTFLRWHAELLSAHNGAALLIPEGFAHGFQALADDTELLYCHTEFYSPRAEGGLHVLDPRLAITWPLPVTELSERDEGFPHLTNGFCGLEP